VKVKKLSDMETTLFIPDENDFKRWIKEAVSEYFQESSFNSNKVSESQDKLLDRKEIANLLRISLVTLTDWIKRGLPSHKQRGRVYFIKSEVLEFIRQKQSKRIKFAGGFQKLEQELV
jgi:predicted DNA-binding transcriptional regulator AlpA